MRKYNNNNNNSNNQTEKPKIDVTFHILSNDIDCVIYGTDNPTNVITIIATNTLFQQVIQQAIQQIIQYYINE